MFPDGTKFYPDIKDGKRGYNTDPARGADTFNPFSSIQDFITRSTHTHGNQDIIGTAQQAIISGFIPGKHYLAFIHSYGPTEIKVISGATTIWNVNCNGNFMYSRSACLLIRANSESVIFTKTYINDASNKYGYSYDFFKLD